MTKIFELIFVFCAALAMPFIVVGSYFNLVAPDQRSKPLSIFFFVISIVYALAYAYFSWKVLKNSEGWRRLIK